MTLTAKDVAAITQLLEESAFDELQLELDGVKLSLRRSGAPPASEERAAAPAPIGAATVAAPVTGPTTAAPAPGAADASDHVVTAPLLGTFYRSPKPGAPPFVAVGSEVTPDTVVCIIEVMKLMNTVRAGVQGRVVHVVARDGALVEYGEALLRVAPSL